MNFTYSTDGSVPTGFSAVIPTSHRARAKLCSLIGGHSAGHYDRRFRAKHDYHLIADALLPEALRITGVRSCVNPPPLAKRWTST